MERQHCVLNSEFEFISGNYHPNEQTIEKLKWQLTNDQITFCDRLYFEKFSHHGELIAVIGYTGGMKALALEDLIRALLREKI